MKEFQQLPTPAKLPPPLPEWQIKPDLRSDLQEALDDITVWAEPQEGRE